MGNRRFRVLLVALLLAGIAGVTGVPANASLHVVKPTASSVATFVGHGGVSTDGLGQFNGGGSVQAEIPNGSHIEQAYLYGTWFNGAPTAGTVIKLAGSDIPQTVIGGPVSNSDLYSSRGDATAVVAAKYALGGGPLYNFTVDNDYDHLDGVALVVIYSNPSSPQTSIAVLDGEQATDGDTTTLTYASPIVKQPGFTTTLALGIGFGYQGGSGHACLGGQYSTVDVNGQRLASCAGNYDDGDAANGALITVGGVGDSTANPVDPNATSGPGGDDDELYDLSSFIHNGDQSLVIHTQNPSNDDGIFLAVVSTDAVVSGVTTEVCNNGVDDDGDTFIDMADPDCVIVPPPVGHAPEFVAPTPTSTLTAYYDSPLPITIKATDPDTSDVVNISLTGAGVSPTSATGNSNSTTLNTVFRATSVGLYSIVAHATDGTHTTDKTININVLRRPTKLTAYPAVASIPRAPKILNLTVSAQLIAWGWPVAGRVVRFYGSDPAIELCHATTDANGFASCQAITTAVQALLNFGYTARFAGDPLYEPSSSDGRVLYVLGLPLP